MRALTHRPGPLVLVVTLACAVLLGACPDRRELGPGDAGPAGYRFDTAYGGDRRDQNDDGVAGLLEAGAGIEGAVDAGIAGGDAAAGSDRGAVADAGGSDAAGSAGQDAASARDAWHPAADGSGVYVAPDSGLVQTELCPPAQEVAPVCLAELDEGLELLCDGADNDCDGLVDELCTCKAGDVQRCFRGPPGRRGVGACQDGQQVCVSAGEWGAVWGPCEGGIAPTAEACDDLDNDCNGCTDEIAGCQAVGSCPGPDDPRVLEGRPFRTYALHGADFYPGQDAEAWSWKVVGTPCDRMFLGLTGSTATAENGQLSFTLHDADQRDASIDFTLSGDYTVTLEVLLSDASIFTCTWIVHVRAPGLRVELCWDSTGPTASALFGGTLDVDLHMAKAGTTPAWFDGTDCDYQSCKRSGALHTAWGYAATDLANCTGPGARGDFTGSCPNPRLDIDNIAQSSTYVPENINLDNPANNDRFRVMVHHFSDNSRVAHPLVNVYCGGELHGTYGQAPDQVPGFDEGGSRNGGDMWRVVDIAMQVDGQGTTIGCGLTPLSPPGGSGYWVTTDDSSY